jgi:hypothetical protein
MEMAAARAEEGLKDPLLLRAWVWWYGRAGPKGADEGEVGSLLAWWWWWWW